MLKRNDEYYFNLAFKQAEIAFIKDEVPIGAVIVFNDKVIAKSYNQMESLKDATAHAEILAITQASDYLNDWRLNDCCLYVTKEPCLMCIGAIINARISKLCYTLKDSCGFIHKQELLPKDLKVFEHQEFEHKSLLLIQKFFKNKRVNNNISE